EAASFAVMNDELLLRGVNLRELCQDFGELSRIAAAFRMPLPAAQWGSFPIRNAIFGVEDLRGPFRPTGIVDRFVALATHDEGVGGFSREQRCQHGKVMQSGANSRDERHGHAPVFWTQAIFPTETNGATRKFQQLCPGRFRVTGALALYRAVPRQ